MSPSLKSTQVVPVSTELMGRTVETICDPDCEQLEAPLTWADLQWTQSLEVKMSAGEEGIEALDQ